MKVAPTLINFKYTLDVSHSTVSNETDAGAAGSPRIRCVHVLGVPQLAMLMAQPWLSGSVLPHAFLSIRPRESEVTPASGPLGPLHTFQFVDALTG